MWYRVSVALGNLVCYGLFIMVGVILILSWIAAGLRGEWRKPNVKDRDGSE